MQNMKIFISHQLYENVWKGVTISHETIFHPRKSMAQNNYSACGIEKLQINCNLIQNEMALNATFIYICQYCFAMINRCDHMDWNVEADVSNNNQRLDLHTQPE